MLCFSEKFNSKWIIDINIKWNYIKFLEENIDVCDKENLNDAGFAIRF